MLCLSILLSVFICLSSQSSPVSFRPLIPAPCSLPCQHRLSPSSFPAAVTIRGRTVPGVRHPSSPEGLSVVQNRDEDRQLLLPKPLLSRKPSSSLNRCHNCRKTDVTLPEMTTTHDYHQPPQPHICYAR